METGQAAGANSVDSLPLKSGNSDSNAEVADFERALASASASLGMLQSFADALLSEGSLKKARVAYRKILDNDQTNIKAMMALSRIDRRLGDNWAACDRLRIATKLNPDNLQVLTDLAAVLRDLDRPEEATSIYQQILVKKEDHVQSHMGLGWIDQAESQLMALRGFLEMPVPDSDTILIVFGGTNNRLWMTFSLLHRILRKTGVSVIYCRDLQRVWYAGGIVGLGHDFQSTVEGFRELVTRYGAKRVLTLGNCIGCLGALRYGLSLGAQGALAISPKLRLMGDLEPHQRARLRPILHRGPAQDKNIHREYLEVSSRPNVALIFGEQCAGDVYNANVMADVPGITLAGIPDSSDADSVKDLLVRGLFEPLLQDFVANGVVSQEIHTLISTPRNPQYGL